jgi:putative tricarboxylic transport membrane protein
LVPSIVGAVTIVLGIALVREALTGGFRGVDEEAELKLPMDWPAFAWVSGGIFAYGLLVERLGFIIASVALFVLVARSFNSKRWVLNGVVGLLLASGIFAIFNYGLGLTLPAGILAPILP